MIDTSKKRKGISMTPKIGEKRKREVSSKKGKKRAVSS